MQTFTAPNPLNGQTLLDELAAAGIVVTELPILTGNKLVLDVTEADRAVVETVLARHDGSDIEPPDVEADREFRAAIEAATTIAALKAALLGTGTAGRAAARPT